MRKMILVLATAAALTACSKGSSGGYVDPLAAPRDPSPIGSWGGAWWGPDVGLFGEVWPNGGSSIIGWLNTPCEPDKGVRMFAGEYAEGVLTGLIQAAGYRISIQASVHDVFLDRDADQIVTDFRGTWRLLDGHGCVVGEEEFVAQVFRPVE